MAIVSGPTTWQFNKRTPLGGDFGGGRIICKSGGVVWIVAPNTTEVSRTWDLRNDAVTTAQANATCGDWFVPNQGQLQNPGYACRTYWDSYSPLFYWSNTEVSAHAARSVYFNPGAASTPSKTTSHFVRAFRCVTY